MQAVTYLTIPEYLRNSDLFKKFKEGEYEVEDIIVPAKYCKTDDSVNSQEDLVHLCHTLRYWGVAELPQSIILAAFGETQLNWDEVATEFGAELLYLNDLTRIRLLPKQRRIQSSISIGSLELIKFLYELQGYELPADITCCTEAASTGHLHILRYFHEIQCHWNQNTTAAAALRGHFNCLQYAHEHGCPWDEATTKYSVLYGHLNCLQYAHEHGCPWNKCCRTGSCRLSSICT